LAGCLDGFPTGGNYLNINSVFPDLARYIPGKPVVHLFPLKNDKRYGTAISTFFNIELERYW
jgi:hypothetical protein